MHLYTINIKDKEKIIWLSIVLAIICSYFLNKLILVHCKLYQDYSWLIDIPSSSLALYYIFYKIFDNYSWRIKWVKKLIKTPDLNGSYKGELISSRDNMESTTEITIKIKQTLSKIKITLSTFQSTSRSEMATLIVGEPDGDMLIYEFINDHKKISDSNLNIHRGVTRLSYNKDDKTLKGTYYTSPERRNYGQISTIKKDKDGK